MDLKFDDVKHEIQTGDLLAFSGWGPLHFGIRLWEWFCYWYSGRKGRPLPKYSHVGMAVWVTLFGGGGQPRLHILEQEMAGCRLIPLDKQLKKFRGSIHWFKVDESQVNLHAMAEYGMDCVYDAYEYNQLFRVFVMNEKITCGPGYCSSLYRVCLQAGGYEWGDWSPMPDEVVDLPVLKEKGKLIL